MFTRSQVKCRQVAFLYGFKKLQGCCPKQGSSSENDQLLTWSKPQSGWAKESQWQINSKTWINCRHKANDQDARGGIWNNAVLDRLTATMQDPVSKRVLPHTRYQRDLSTQCTASSRAILSYINNYTAELFRWNKLVPKHHLRGEMDLSGSRWTVWLEYSRYSCWTKYAWAMKTHPTIYVVPPN